jgi:hypothetical protein
MTCGAGTDAGEEAEGIFQNYTSLMENLYLHQQYHSDLNDHARTPAQRLCRYEKQNISIYITPYTDLYFHSLFMYPASNLIIQQVEAWASCRIRALQIC